MLFKNKLTGLVWDVVDPDHIKRCQNDDNYEVVEKPKETTKSTTKTTARKTVNKAKKE
mgnify:CR=1 FL=1